MLGGLLDLLFPRLCGLCGDPVEAATPLCPRCRGEVDLTAPGCAHCDGPIDCTRCPRPGTALSACRAGAWYSAAGTEILQRFKFGEGPMRIDPGAEAIAFWFVLRAAERLPEADAVVPVPLHRRRLRLRGFSPTSVLARRVAREFHLPYRPLLRRVRDTPSQTGLSAAARRANLARAFRASRDAPRRVWLVDDVVTTGSTLEACARTLRDAGAREVYGLCALRTPLRDPG